MMPMGEQGSPDAGICGACGLCCNGAIFGYGRITPEEVPAARKNSLRIIEQDGTPAIALPCPAHRGDHCSVYAERPQICAAYRCKLLRRHQAGEVGRAEALARIAEARRIVAGLRAMVGVEEGNAAGTPLWDGVKAHAESDSPIADTAEWRRKHQALLLEAALVEAFISRHFREDSPKSAAPSPDGSRTGDA